MDILCGSNETYSNSLSMMRAITFKCLLDHLNAAKALYSLHKTWMGKSASENPKFPKN